MKNQFIILLLLVSVLSAGTYVYEYEFSNPVFIQENGHMLVELENCMQEGVAGEPLLPHYAFSILLPQGETLESLEGVILSSQSYPVMMQLLPKQADRPLSLGKSGQFLKKEMLYQKQEYLSKTIKADVHYLHGAAIVTGTINPAKYFPASGKVNVSKRISLKINTDAFDISQSLDARAVEELKIIVENPELIDSYSKTSLDESESMLIISSENYKTLFDTLVNHYAKYGIKATFLSTSTISSDYSGVDLQEKIRSAIYQQYLLNGLDYVLLGGNTQIVPARGLSCNVMSGNELYSSNNIPSDLYYVALDGNWDNNENGIFGEYNDTTSYDEADLFPELAIGRFPAETPEQMQNMINKSILYQRFPIVEEMDKHVFFGEFLWPDPETWASDYMELLIGTRNDNGYTTVGLPSNLTITKWYDQDSLNYWDEETVKGALAEGYSFLHHDGHANTSYMMKFNYHEMNDSDFVSVNGIDHTTPVFYSSGCNCGGFDYEYCIASKIVTSPYISVGGVFNSRYGWFNEGQTEGPSIHLQREFGNVLYDLHYPQFGRALSLSRVATAPWVTALGQHEQNALRWNFYTINVLGDPAMNIYSQRPVSPEVSYDLSQLHLGKISAQVKRSSLEMENAGLAVLDTHGDMLGFARSDASGQVTVELSEAPSDGDTLLCYISGENLLLSDTSIVSLESSANPVDSYVLLNAYPNPFNPQATIDYTLPQSGNIDINIFDIRGQLVETLFQEFQVAGQHKIIFNAKHLSAGIYFCRLQTSQQKITKKLILLK